jgi:RNA polymerase sigma factor (sigma-70 family)
LVAVPSIGRADQVIPRRGAPEADATRDLYERYARQIHAYCVHQLGNREEAEDAVQSTFLNAFRGLKRGVDPEFESAWLYKIAENVCLTRQRSSSRRRRIESPGDLDAIQDILPSHQPDRDELIRLPEALEEMPEQQRRALLLREWQGLSYKEIAVELDLSQAAVETLLFRARRSLASGLTDEPKAKKACVGKKLRAGSDLGSVVALLKTLIFSGGVKVAASVAAVAATSMVAATPAIRHSLEQAVAPSHAQQPKVRAVVPKAAARSLGARTRHATTSSVVVSRSSASGALAARASLRVVHPAGSNAGGAAPVGGHVATSFHAPAEAAPVPTAVAPAAATAVAADPVSTPAAAAVPAPAAAPTPAVAPRDSGSPGTSPSGGPNDVPPSDRAVLTPVQSHAQSTADKAEVKAARDVAKTDAKAPNGNGKSNGKKQRDIASASPSVSDPADPADAPTATDTTVTTTTTTTTTTAAAPVASAPATPPGQAKKDSPAPPPAPAPAVAPTPTVDASSAPQPAPAAAPSGNSKTQRGNGNGHRK